MRTTDNGLTPRPARAYRLPEDGPRPDLPLYERLIDDGIAAADAQGSAVDHLTTRRLAIWLAARPQSRSRPHRRELRRRLRPDRPRRHHAPSPPRPRPARPSAPRTGVAGNGR